MSFQTEIQVLLDFLQMKFAGSDIAFIGSGWSSIVFQVDNNIVRFPKQNTEDYVFEEYICPIVQVYSSFEIPQVSFVNDIYPFAIHPKIEGTQLTFNTTKNYKGIVDDIALFLSQIHNIPLDDKIRIAPIESPTDVNKIEGMLSHFFNHKERSVICKKYEEIYSQDSFSSVFIHADLQRENMIVDYKGRLKGVIDWCNSGKCEEERDLIKLLDDFGDVFLRLFIQRYEEITNDKINIARVYDLRLISLIDSLYWSNPSVVSAGLIVSKIKKYLNETISQ